MSKYFARITHTGTMARVVVMTKSENSAIEFIAEAKIAIDDLDRIEMFFAQMTQYVEMTYNNPNMPGHDVEWAEFMPFESTQQMIDCYQMDHTIILDQFTFSGLTNNFGLYKPLEVHDHVVPVEINGIMQSVHKTDIPKLLNDYDIVPVWEGPQLRTVRCTRKAATTGDTKEVG